MDEHLFTSYFDVHQGYRLLTHNHAGTCWKMDVHGQNLSFGTLVSDVSGCSLYEAWKSEDVETGTCMHMQTASKRAMIGVTSQAQELSFQKAAWFLQRQRRAKETRTTPSRKLISDRCDSVIVSVPRQC